MADDTYLVLARKWRPQTFEEVVGQEHITRTLQNSIAAGRVGHAFLFIGSRGIGKTTTARILAKALNCESADAPTAHPCGTCGNCISIAAGNSIDVIEIDGASNNSVDDVRQIRENIRMVPSQSRYKVYVIDEVHQLSSSAFNALLKTLEEPPEHAVFMLATTEAHKVPATIVSRCQRYDFRRIGLGRIVELLRKILDHEGVKGTDEALYAIARAADGGIRDAESILEQLISYCDKEITFQDVFNLLGLVDWQVLNDLCDAMLEKDIAKQLSIVEEVTVSGKDLSQFVQDILHYFRNLLVCKTADPRGLLALPDEEITAMQQFAGRFSLTTLIRLVEQFAELSKEFDSQLAQRIALEALLIRISKVAVEMSVDSVLEKLVQLGAGGIGPVPAVEASAASEADAAHRSLGAAAARAATIEEPPETEELAGPPEEADEDKPVVLTTQNAARHWDRVVHAVADHSLNLAMALGRGKPAAVEGDTVVLRFAGPHAESVRMVEADASRDTIARALAAMTSNVHSFRCEVYHEDSDGLSEKTAQEHPATRYSSRVSGAEAREALSNPEIAKVVDLFKGRIVDVKHGVKFTDPD